MNEQQAQALAGELVTHYEELTDRERVEWFKQLILMGKDIEIALKFAVDMKLDVEPRIVEEIPYTGQCVECDRVGLLNAWGLCKGCVIAAMID